MDFSLTEEQAAVREAASQIFTDTCAPEVLRQVEREPEWFHRRLWSALAGADLLGLCLPERVGGAGRGIVEACVLLEEAGRAVAPIPLWPTLSAALAIGELGDDDQVDRWLAGVASGERILAVALEELGAVASDPWLAARRDGEGWRLDGTKAAVVGAHLAAAFVVTARDADGALRAFVVAADALGVRIERQDTFSHEPQALVHLDDVAAAAADELGDGRPGLVERIVDLATVGVCALAAGVADGGMRRTAAYVSERQQFGRPVGSFQAVGHRAADCYVDVEAMRLSMLLAASTLDGTEGATASREVAIAKYWAAWGGRRVGHAALHLHGGISIDLDYPIHRYFLWAKQLELRLGAASEQLDALGTAIAARASA
jgi:acyl-CoA dehydrogenase